MEAARVLAPKGVLRLVTILPFVLAIFVIAFIVIIAAELITFPDDGIEGLDSSGKVISIDPSGPSVGKLQEGDTILAGQTTFTVCLEARDDLRASQVQAVPSGAMV